MAIRNPRIIPAGPGRVAPPAASATGTPPTTPAGRGRGPRRAESAPAHVAPAVYAASTLSLAASLVHLWVGIGYFQVWYGYGAFFLAAAFAQGLFSVALMRWPGPVVSLAGVFGNLAVVALYVVTRTGGIPVGPEAPRGAIDAGLLDMSTTAAELATVVFVVSLLGGRARSVAINAALLLGVGFWVLRLTGYLS